jgi:hypothetical protein
MIDQPDTLSFREVDLSRCHFLDADLRKVQIVGVIWPRIPTWFGTRFGIYDESVPLEADQNRPWSRIEHLYRQLKQNYEDQRDYERAGDFHYGEKEMRRKNPELSWGLWLLLTLYWLVSGYGERFLQPLLWAAGLFVVSTVLYLSLGLEGIHPGNQKHILSLLQGGDWLQAAHYSFRTMVFLSTSDLATPVSYARVVYTVQSLFSPLFLGLSALAIRQKLKR